MRIPIPKNRLVAFTLIGALLTTVVAGGLAFPGLGLVDDQSSETSADAPTSQQVAADAPTPNEDFTPAVQSSSGEYEEEHDEYEEENEDEEEHGEYEEEDEDEEEDE